MATRVIQNRYYGYDFGSRQPCSLIETKLTTANVADFDNLDRWLSEHLRVDLSSIAGVERREADGHSARASDILNRSLALYGELVRGAGIPSFEHGQVLRLAQLPGEVDRFGATLALPVVDRMPLELFARIFQASLLVITTRLAEEPTAEAVQALFAELDQDIVQNAKRFNPFEATGQTICKLAQQCGTPWRHIGRGVVRLGWGARSKLLYRSSIEQDSAIGAQVSGSKRQSVLLLKSAGFPAPEHELVGSVEAATEAAQALGWPVVVKPENAARAEGVTIDVTSAETLRAAFATARELSEDVLVERQVPGLCHRIAVAGDRIIYVVKRIPRGVTGDGRHTIRELAAKANAELQAVPPWQRLKEFPLDALALDYLAKQGLAEQSVPAEGQFANLRPHSTNEWGGDIENVTQAIHPENARLAIEAVRLFGLTVGGVDLMTTDISRPWHETGAVIIELNYMPQINLLRREKEAAALVPALLGSDGRIPVHLVIGEGDLRAAARALKGKLRQHGRACHLTSADHTDDEEGNEIVMPLATLFDRSLALIMRRDVRELIVVGQPSELYGDGAAVDRFATVHVVGGDEQAARRIAREIGRRFPAGSFHRLSAD